jgi:hypothetical protein
MVSFNFDEYEKIHKMTKNGIQNTVVKVSNSEGKYIILNTNHSLRFFEQNADLSFDSLQVFLSNPDYSSLNDKQISYDEIRIYIIQGYNLNQGGFILTL